MSSVKSQRQGFPLQLAFKGDANELAKTSINFSHPIANSFNQF